MLALVPVRNIPNGKSDNPPHVRVMKAGSVGNHDMPIIEARIDEVLEEQFGELDAILREFMGVFVAIVPSRIEGHGRPHHLHHTIQISKSSSADSRRVNGVRWAHCEDASSGIAE